VPKKITAQFDGECVGCQEEFEEGTEIEFSEENGGWVVSDHDYCVDTEGW